MTTGSASDGLRLRKVYNDNGTKHYHLTDARFSTVAVLNAAA